jgi:hypothetical protein
MIMSKNKPVDTDLANYAEKFLNVDKGQQLFFGFIFVGLLIKIGLGFVAGATALLWGYFIMIFSIIGLLFLKVDTKTNDIEALKLLLNPLLLLILVLLWNISLSLRFFDEINKEKVPTQYFMWSWFSTVLVTSIVFLSILAYVVENESFAIYSYVLLVMNLIVTAIQQVILESFTVDG